MDINKLTFQFHAFEEKEIHREDIKLWDIVRFDVFYLLFYSSKSVAKKQKVRSCKNVLLHLFYFCLFLYSLRKSYDFLFFSCSRFQNKEHKQYDPNILDIYEILKNDALCIDSYFSEFSYQHPVVFDYFLRFRYKFYLRKYIKKTSNKFPLYILDSIQKEFGVVIEENFVHNLLAKFELEREHYFKLFKYLKPEVIFLVQNGIQKGMFMAAKECNIPMVELQHGLVDYSHLAYSYPKAINIEKLILPSYFFAYSEFWKKRINYPVKEVIVMGNTEASKIVESKVKLYDVCVVCADVYMSELFLFIDELIDCGYTGKVCLKLHPNQFGEVDFIRNKYQIYSNIYVIYTEVSMKTIISQSYSMLAIQSTSVYEALDAGLNVFILKKLDYHIHDDIFDYMGVHLIVCAKGFIDFYVSDSECNVQHKFFKPFDYLKFQSFISKV